MQKLINRLDEKRALRSPNALKISFLLTLAAVLPTSCATQNCDLDAIYKMSAIECDQQPCPPGNPQDGPGSGKSPHKAVEVTELKEGMLDSLRSVIYTPAAPAPKTAPVILFLHGYFDMTPEKYDAMLKHYARKGFIVIYPSYGNGLDPKKWAENAEGSWKRAIQFLNSKGPVKPDLKQVAYVGHSIGGMLALHLAQKESASSSPGITVPKLIIAIETAGIPSPAYPYITIDDLSRIPKSTKLLLMMAEETYLHREKEADHCENNNRAPTKTCDGFISSRKIYQGTTQIPNEQKTAILIQSDNHGKLGLRSEHNGIQGECKEGGKPLDAIDTWGYWRITVEALQQTLGSDPTDLAFLRTDRIRAGGTWSDGQPAKPAVSLDTCFANGSCPTAPN